MREFPLEGDTTGNVYTPVPFCRGKYFRVESAMITFLHKSCDDNDSVGSDSVAGR